jgi:hypothetical protein
MALFGATEGLVLDARKHGGNIDATGTRMNTEA